jgi:lycopene beta-cyclase
MFSASPRSGSSLILVGGGLANGLIALRLAATRPDVAVTIIESGERLGGEHTWSFFDDDLSPSSWAWIAPLIVYRWPTYEVRFPTHGRTIAAGYSSLNGHALHDAVVAAKSVAILCNAKAATIEPRRVGLEDGRTLSADAVIDGRGPGPLPHLSLGFQKFVGLEVELDGPHGLSGPIIMDATVAQQGGYRFIYVLPFGPRRVLIEDTRYTDGPDLDGQAFIDGIGAYATARGWTVRSVLRREEGVLPVALDGDIDGHWAQVEVAQSGLRAALFHPTTGYSFPDAVRAAELIANLPTLSADAVRTAVQSASVGLWRSRSFYRLVNRMLFRAAQPNLRYKVMQRFYRLNASLIGRFYAGRSTRADRIRILVGKPPVGFGKAIACIPETGKA